jgi:hypothetical protein
VTASPYTKAALARCFAVSDDVCLGNVAPAPIGSGCAGTLWCGWYEKQHYLVTVGGGAQAVCWPNAGFMNATDGSGRMWSTDAGVGVQPITTEDALYLLRKARHA